MSHDPQPYFVNIYHVPGAEQHWVGGKCRTREEAQRTAIFTKPIYRLRVVEKPQRGVIGTVHIIEKTAPPGDWSVGNNRAIFQAGAIVAACMLAAFVIVYATRNFL